MPSTTVQPWKSVNPNRKDPLQTERAIRTLDRQAQIQNGQVITDVNNVLTQITNITNGTTTVYAKWSSYTGAVWLLWFFWTTA